MQTGGFGAPISSDRHVTGLDATGTFTLNDKEANVKDLKVGDLITFWIREGVYGVSPTLTEKPMRLVKPTAMPAN